MNAVGRPCAALSSKTLYGLDAMTELSPLDEPRPGRLTIDYRPACGASVVENPPRFTWLPVVEDEALYVLRVSRDPAFAAAATMQFAPLPLNFFTPDTVFEPGEWFWSYAVWSDAEETPSTAWSTTRRFVVGQGVPETPLPKRGVRYGALGKQRPRLWLGADKLARFRKALKDDPDHCGWQSFFAKSVAPWIDAAIMPEPEGYPDHKREASVWRATYIACQELLYAIRHMAIAGQVLDDAALRARARDWLLAAAGWNPAGTTSRGYTDEWAFRVNVALAWGYDWLHEDLSPDERDIVRAALLARTRETADHVISNARIQLFPFDSHAVRAVSAVLVPASMALLGEADEAEGWLDYAVEFLFTVYSPWGDEQGGWAEGAHYWMTGMAYLIEAANLLRAATGLDLYHRPFFQNTADFPLYTKAPETRRTTFGDDATQGDRLCIKMGYNVRQFAGVTGNPAYQWYFETVRDNDPGTEKAFYNWGWWDLNFDDLIYAHDFDNVAAAPPVDIPRLKHFEGIGWACIQHCLDRPDQHIQFNFKSSPFGAISHSHGDQNAFCLHAFDEDLAINSGYYVAFNSTMHRNWRRQTRSKNAVLIDGQGQYGGMDKAMAARATGRILEAEDRGDHVYIAGDATEAYAVLNPAITMARREVWFIHDQYFVILDSIDAETPVTLDWLLHTETPMTLGEKSFRYAGQQAGFYGQVLWSEGGRPALSQSSAFTDVNPADYGDLPVSSCMTMAFPKSTRHRVATLLVPYPLSQPRRVFSFLDDQGYDCDLYFTDADDRSFKITVPKSLNVGGRA